MGICFYGGIEQEVCVRRMHWAANAGRLGVFLNYCVTNEHFENPGLWGYNRLSFYVIMKKNMLRLLCLCA